MSQDEDPFGFLAQKYVLKTVIHNKNKLRKLPKSDEMANQKTIKYFLPK